MAERKGKTVGGVFVNNNLVTVWTAFILFQVIFAPPVSANSDEPPILSHHQDIVWKVSKKNISCSASTKLSSNIDETDNGLIISKAGLSGTFHLTVVSSSFSLETFKWGYYNPDAVLLLQSANEKLDSTFRSLSVYRMNRDIVPGIGGEFAQDDLDFFNSHPTLNVFLGEQFIAQLDRLQILEAVRKLDGCYSELLREWSIDRNELAKIKTFAIPEKSPSRWVHPVDFAFMTEGKSVDSRVTMKFNINADGKVDDCQVMEAGNLKYLPRTVCKRFQNRARYSAAKDLEGNNISSPTIITVRLTTNPNNNEIPNFGE